MSALTMDPNNVFRDFVTDGVPASGNWNPVKPEIRRMLSEHQASIIALIAGQGGDIDLPNLLIRYTVTGGTPNAITATPNLPVPDGPGLALFSIQITQANTGPVTINGKPLRTNTGNNLSADGLAAGGMYLFLDNGDHFRLLSDEVSSAIVAAAEAAAVRAEDAAAGLNLPTIGAGDAGKTLIVKEDESGFELALPSITTPTRTSMKAIPALNAGQTVFLTEAGREGTFILKAGSPPVTDTQEGVYVVSDTAGYYWERLFGPSYPTIKAFGAPQDGVGDDLAAIQGSLDVIGVALIDRAQGPTCKISGTVRLKGQGNRVIGLGRPKVTTGAASAFYIENSFQTISDLVINGAAAALNTPAIRIRTSARSMVEIHIENVWGEYCGAGIMDDNTGTNRANFVTIREVTFAGHRGYGVATWDCWASYYIDQVVIDRVAMSGADYNFPAFYFKDAEGIFFLNCAQNGSSATSVQSGQDGAVFENCNFVVVQNFIPDHSGGTGLRLLSCSNFKVADSTLTGYGPGFTASNCLFGQMDNVFATQMVGDRAANSDAFFLTGCQSVRGSNLIGRGCTRNGFNAVSCSRLHIEGEFSSNGGRGVVTLTSGNVNIFHGCLMASNTGGNYSLSGPSDFLRDCILTSGSIADVTGPGAA